MNGVNKAARGDRWLPSSWCAKVKRDLLARGIFTSVTDLAPKLRGFITTYNERAKPVRWAYADPSRRIA
jgi:hypothetical protein